MSVDPLIQSPTSTQSINPYSYIMNNPLAGTDPTGYAAQCSDDTNCDLSSIDVKDVTSIQVTKDGNAIINTNNGSFQVNSIGGKNVQGSFSASSIGNLSSVASKPSYGNDSNFTKGFAEQSNKRDMSAALSMTPVGQAVDSIKSGIEGVEAAIDEYNETGSVTGAVIAGGGLAVERYVERKLKLSRAPDVVGDTPKFRGGAHRDMTKPSGDGLDSHHMPARQSNPGTAPNDGPAIQMDPHDHRLTSSNGANGRAGAIYRAEVAEMIKSGNMRGAMAREVYDVRRAALEGSGSRTKYNQAIGEMLDYARSQGMLNK
ncbi:hypothetical protein [Shewanella sedimentimangrovi]